LRRLFARKLISALRARKTSWKWLMILSVDVKRSRLLADFESPDPEDLISCQILGRAIPRHVIAFPIHLITLQIGRNVTSRGSLIQGSSVEPELAPSTEK
jgi:hypothetical protein